MTGRILLGDNLERLAEVADASVPLVYVDPPFNTGRRRELRTIRARRAEDGDRAGYGGKLYATEEEGDALSFGDSFDDYLDWMRPRLAETHRVLAPNGSFFLHVDPRESHYLKVMLDGIFGRASYLNEIVWAYDFGARTRSRWPAKHDTILWYAKDPDDYVFDYDAIDRIPYMAPGLQTPERAARGKTPTDVWWHTIVPPGGKERTGYPTQKPLGVVERIVKAHSAPGDLCLDYFAGSGTLGEAAARHDREFLLIDSNPEAVRVMAERLADWDPIIEVPARGDGDG